MVRTIPSASTGKQGGNGSPFCFHSLDFLSQSICIWEGLVVPAWEGSSETGDCSWRASPDRGLWSTLLHAWKVPILSAIYFISCLMILPSHGRCVFSWERGPFKGIGGLLTCKCAWLTHKHVYLVYSWVRRQLRRAGIAGQACGGNTWTWGKRLGEGWRDGKELILHFSCLSPQPALRWSPWSQLAPVFSYGCR